MAKQKNIITEFRNYPLRVEFPILLLTGNQWWISDVPSANLHFHNCLEIGLCHEGEGSDFLSLLIDTVNFLPKQEAAPETLDSASTLSIVPALEYIKQNYMTTFSMDYLAELCGLSPTHFRRIFNLAMGRSPLEYLNTVRINKACYLLRSTENSILNISEDVGFHSISSFNRYFSRMIGMSPREYRCCDSQDERLQKSKIMKFNGWMEAER